MRRNGFNVRWSVLYVRATKTGGISKRKDPDTCPLARKTTPAHSGNESGRSPASERALARTKKYSTKWIGLPPPHGMALSNPPEQSRTMGPSPRHRPTSHWPSKSPLECKPGRPGTHKPNLRDGSPVYAAEEELCSREAVEDTQTARNVTPRLEVVRRVGGVAYKSRTGTP